VVARTASPRFARVRIAPEQRAASAPLHLQLHLANGRRVELLLNDEQLPRVLELLEQPT
jgi:DNA-binding TFAR19-related protein (PDSD5 family)